MADEFWELYKDHPRWQRKRLGIMQRASFACEWCSAEDKTLNVHHSYYERGAKPWDYPDDSLHCLCEECHKEHGKIMTEIRRAMGRIGLTDFTQILGYLNGLEMQRLPQVSHEVIDAEHACGIADAWGVDDRDIISSTLSNRINGETLNLIAKLGGGKVGYQADASRVFESYREALSQIERRRIKSDGLLSNVG